MSMEISTQHHGDVAVFYLDGNINHETLGMLSRQVDRAISGGCHNLILCLSKTRILLSSGIGFFVDVYDMAKEAGGSLVLAEVPKEIRLLIKLAFLEEFFGEMPDLAAALDRFDLTLDKLSNGLPEGTRRASGLYTAALRPETEGDGGTAESAPAKPTIKPPAKPAEAPAAAKAEPAEAHGAQLSEDDVKQLITRHMPGRRLVDALDFFVSRKHSSADAKDVAASLGWSPKEATQALKELATRHVLKSMGGGVYNYAPESGLNTQLKTFFERWHSSTEHSKLLKLVLAAEQ